MLLVEDDDSVREATKIALSLWYDITDFDKCSKALEHLEKEKFDLVLLDIIIRDEGYESGIEALKTINHKYPSLPVIMFSGSVTWMQRWEMLKKHGASAFLNKPFNINEAKETIDSCIKSKND